MKIGSQVNQNFMKINVRNISDQDDENQDQPQGAEDISKAQTNQASTSARSLNLMAGNFVHSGDGNEKDNYSRMNLKGLKSSQSLMSKYNSFMVNLVSERMAFTDELVASGVLRMDAKAAAAAEYEKKGMDAHEKLKDDINHKELEKQAKDSKDFNEEHTEEVVEKKQEEKTKETKETAKKAEGEQKENIAEHSSESIQTNGTDENDTTVAAASNEEIVSASEESTVVSTVEGQVVKDSGTGENVDEWI